MIKLSRKTFALVGLMALAGVAADGPGTYFDPKKGTANVVTAAKGDGNAVAKRTIAFLGGSITEMHGYRPRVMAQLRAKFPQVAFTEIAAGLSSTCSDAAAFRFAEDVLAKGVPDVLFVEEAVNDDQDGHFDRTHMIRGMEGVIRQVRAANPACRVVMGLLPNHGQFNQLSKGQIPLAYAVHGEIAKHYDLPVADVTAALVASAKAGGFGWGEYRDCHPSDAGCDFAANVILAAMLESYDPLAKPKALPLPPPMDAASYFTTGTVTPAQLTPGEFWKVSPPAWKEIPGGKRGYFTIGPAIWTETPKAELSVSFKGTALAAFLTAGPDCGDLEVSVDGEPPRVLSLRADYGSLHYPYVQFLAEELKPGAHRAVLRALPRVHDEKTFAAIRIHRLYFK